MSRLKWAGGGALAVVMAIVVGSFWPQKGAEQVDELRRQNERLARQRRELLEVVDRLNIERRVAEVEVLQQHLSEGGKVLQTVVRFTEFDRQGNPTPPKVFGIPGNVPHFDALVIKFGNEHVQTGDPLRGKSLALFRRIYGDSQAPEAGYWLDRSGDIPDPYRVDRNPSEFEVRLWSQFWSYATDPDKARAAGVRVAQGEAVYAPVSPGERWVLTLEADGGLNLFKQQSQPTAAEVAVSPGPGPRPADARLSAPSPLAQGRSAP